MKMKQKISKGNGEQTNNIMAWMAVILAAKATKSLTIMIALVNCILQYSILSQEAAVCACLLKSSNFVLQKPTEMFEWPSSSDYIMNGFKTINNCQKKTIIRIIENIEWKFDRVYVNFREKIKENFNKILIAKPTF